jgi:hypothetical protein
MHVAHAEAFDDIFFPTLIVVANRQTDDCADAKPLQLDESGRRRLGSAIQTSVDASRVLNTWDVDVFERIGSAAKPLPREPRDHDDNGREDSSCDDRPHLHRTSERSLTERSLNRRRIPGRASSMP